MNIEMISGGRAHTETPSTGDPDAVRASEVNISCVIDARDATRAMNILHTHLYSLFWDRLSRQTHLFTFRRYHTHTRTHVYSLWNGLAYIYSFSPE